MSENRTGKKFTKWSIEAKERRSKERAGIAPHRNKTPEEIAVIYKKIGDSLRGKILLHRRGQNSPNWKGGTSKINHILRNQQEYKNWRKAVFERDNWTCVWCGKQDKTIQADHIKPFAYFPEVRYEISNGRTLCLECHKKTDSYMNRWFSPKI